MLGSNQTGGLQEFSARDRVTARQLAGNINFTPATLYSRIDPSWIPKRFLLEASLKIAQTIAKPDGRLIISWPPRHGKSRLATIATPIWTLENFPDKEIILTTYGADLSTDFGREIRDIFVRNKHLLSQEVRPDVKSVGRFMTTAGGAMRSVGLGGGITGRGADVFLIDDYIKLASEAASKGKRDSDWEWFTGTAYHRLEPNGSVIIIATRWHWDDLIGRILKNFPGEWEHVKFTAEALEDDILGREIGEPLFPERYDKKALQDKKKVLGTYYYNAIYQQDPDNKSDKITDRDWIEIVDVVPFHNKMKYARIWDFGGATGKSDYNAAGLVAVDPHTKVMYILNMWRKQCSPQALEIKAKVLADVDGLDTKVIIEEEPGSSGTALVSHYVNNVLPDYTVVGSPNTLAKLVRAMPMVAAAEAGKVKLLRGKWNEDFLSEFDDFPDGDHDDQIDTVAIGYNDLLDKKPMSPTWGRNTKADKKVGPQEELRGGDRRSTEYHLSKEAAKRPVFLVKGSTWGR